MGEVIRIEFYTDLPTRARNRLRYALEHGEWRRRWREAAATNDYEEMDRLDGMFDSVGLP